ncbi:MAG: hypothetical protein L0Y61_00135 [Epsilonproteobacteria bacterium]|nr:hypothetical protein [Campylobacterota bacterium]
MFKKSVLAVTLLFMVGCSSKSALTILDGDVLYERGLEYSRVGDVINSFETKAILNATYLNSTDSSKYDDKFHNFLVGIYITEDNENEENKFLNNKKYTLTLNGQDINKSEELQTTHELWEHIPLKNPYAKYYIVSFNKQKNVNPILLEYSNPNQGKVTLSFQAE